jgi:hypothetical protein
MARYAGEVPESLISSIASLQKNGLSIVTGDMDDCMNYQNFALRSFLCIVSQSVSNPQLVTNVICLGLFTGVIDSCAVAMKYLLTSFSKAVSALMCE